MKMKKLLIIILFFIGKLTFSQEKIDYGLNVGINYFNVRGNDFADQYNYDFGFLIGITFEYTLKNNFSVITGINYEKKNTINENSNTLDSNGNVLGNAVIKEKFDYLNLPILLKINFNNSFFLNGGPYISYLLSSETEIDSSVSETVSNIDSTDRFKKVDLGLSFGIGKGFKLNEKNNLNFEIRYNLGVTNISDVPVINNGKIKTNSMNLLMGLTF